MRRALLFLACLILPASAQTLFLIGDSTVKNGRGDGAGGLWGWGDRLAPHFETSKLRIANRALGGRSSRTFLTEGLWEKTRLEIKPGDFVVIQFGHNDGGEIAQGDRPRASLKGNGDDAVEVVVERTGKAETVHSYGWYLRRYIREAKAAGASAIVFSPIPRNVWKDDARVTRAASDYSLWASQAAAQAGAAFVDFNALIADRYDRLTQARVAANFFTAKDHTHTTDAGATLNAEIAAGALFDVEGLKPFRLTPVSHLDHPGSKVSVALPEGNYRVVAKTGPAPVTIKAETRRLMLEKAPAGTHAFTVNVRTPLIAGGAPVTLKDREKGVPHWDGDLSLEIHGPVETLDIYPANVPTLFLLGDSTVTDQPREPWNSWGQMLTRFLKPGIAVANHAESGESLRSSEAANRFRKVLSTLKAGDWVFIQYGHNDQKHKEPEEAPMLGYKSRLKRLCDEVRALGGHPVLITSMHRISFDDQFKIVNSLGGFPEAVRVLAREEKLPLIDLHAMSKAFYEALPAADLQKLAFMDKTHHNSYGSYELAKCVVEGIRQNSLAMQQFIVDGLPRFDPAHPDSAATFDVPASPEASLKKPDGN